MMEADTLAALGFCLIGLMMVGIIFIGFRDSIEKDDE